MKKLLLLFILFNLILSAEPESRNSITSSAVTFETGKILMLLDKFGRIEVYAPDLDTKQISQITLLVGGYEESVFDYFGDAGEPDSSEGPHIDSVSFAGYTLTDTINNSYSNNRPAYQVSYDVYGWDNAAYSIIKLNIKNIDSLYSYDAKPGFDIQPQIENEYGGEQYEYIADGDYFRIYKEDSLVYRNLGFKFLNSSTQSLVAIPWDRNYNSGDSILYKYLNYDSIITSFQSDTSDTNGLIIFTSTESTVIDTGESFDIYIAVAVGDSASDIASAMTAAEARYANIITDIDPGETEVPNDYYLSQNYPNPFNPSTTIEYKIPSGNFVELKIYDVLGREVKTLVNEYKNSGAYKVSFDAGIFASGVYFYRLKAGNFVQTKKMLLMK